MVENVEGLYFDWLISFVYDDRFYVGLSYRKLLEALDSVEFRPIMPMDRNRYDDGLMLRYRFGIENDIPESEVESSFANIPCSILEMMVALSSRIEETIMTNPDIGDRTSHWFWEMIGSLGLSDMTDANFDRFKVEDILQNFNNRNYSYDGRGGLFTINNPVQDLRNVEIWYQMQEHLGEL